jgi:hypothetical protein
MFEVEGDRLRGRERYRVLKAEGERWGERKRKGIIYVDCIGVKEEMGCVRFRGESWRERTSVGSF